MGTTPRVISAWRARENFTVSSESPLFGLLGEGLKGVFNNISRTMKVMSVWNVRVRQRLIWITRFSGEVLRCASNIWNILSFFFYCLSSWLNLAQLISMCKQNLLLRFWDAGVQCILILIWCSLSVQSQHHPIRGLPLWVGVGVGDDGSGGFVSWDFNETSVSKYLPSTCSHRT